MTSRLGTHSPTYFGTSEELECSSLSPTPLNQTLWETNSAPWETESVETDSTTEESDFFEQNMEKLDEIQSNTFNVARLPPVHTGATLSSLVVNTTSVKSENPQRIKRSRPFTPLAHTSLLPSKITSIESSEENPKTISKANQHALCSAAYRAQIKAKIESLDKKINALILTKQKLLVTFSQIYGASSMLDQIEKIQRITIEEILQKNHIDFLESSFQEEPIDTSTTILPPNTTTQEKRRLSAVKYRANCELRNNNQIEKFEYLTKQTTYLEMLIQTYTQKNAERIQRLFPHTQIQ